MAPTSYSYSCLPMDEYPKKLGDRKLPVWVGILLFLLVATLMIILQMQMAGSHKQPELVEKLQEEIKTLKQELQDKSAELKEKSAELEQLRKENEALISAKCLPNSVITLGLSMATVLLTLSFQALLA